MTPEQALACIEQERLDVLAEGHTEADCNMIASYVLASAYRKLRAAKLPESSPAWIPVGERRPEGDEEVLCTNIMGGMDITHPAQIRSAWNAGVRDGDGCFYTYWAPLPKWPSPATRLPVQEKS